MQKQHQQRLDPAGTEQPREVAQYRETIQTFPGQAGAPVARTHQQIEALLRRGPKDHRSRNYLWTWKDMGNTRMVVIRTGSPLPNGFSVRENTIPAPGESVRFWINVVVRKQKRITLPTGRRRREFYFLTEKPEVLSWLENHLQGLRMNVCSLQEKMVPFGHRTAPKVVTKYWEVTGGAQVVDQDQVACIMKNGIGAMKAFGFGMLLLTDA